MSKFKVKNIIKGFSLVEVLLAISIFALGVTGMIGAIIYARETAALSGNRSRASYLANEGIEALKNMSDSDFSNLASGLHGLAVSGNQWTFSGTSDTTESFFTRQINISDVDANTKQATVNVTWQQNLQRSGSVALNTYLTNWRAPTGIPSEAMMVYSKLATNSIPYYRIWNSSTSSWGGENPTRSIVFGSNIQYIVLKHSRTRNEAILGTLDASGNIVLQVWNGSSWGTPTALPSIGTVNDAYRGFDIEYETNRGNAVVVYNNANSADPAYRTWDGNNWSSAVSITAPPTTGVPRWIELAPNPKSDSNEIAMMLLDANTDVYGMAWNGSSWSNMGVSSVWDISASNAAMKGIDIAYEQISGDAMFIWGSATQDRQYYRIWNGSTPLGSITQLNIIAMDGVANWVELAPRPGSNEIMYGVQDATSDLNTRFWNGSNWDAATQHPEHSGTTEAANSKNFDIVYETHPLNSGKAWLAWGDGTATATISKKQWSGSSWGSATSLAGNDDTSYVTLNAKPGTGEIFLGAYESTTSATDDILEWHLTGGGTVWSGKGTVWGGSTIVNPAMFRIDISSR